MTDTEGEFNMEQMSRRDARVKAYELIFMIDACDDISLQLDTLKKELKDHRKHYRYIADVVNAVCDNKDEIDAIIKESLTKSWNYSRLSKMSIATLRLAVAEIKYMEDIPANVSINEAVELAKLYGDEGESTFVNGVLADVVK